MNEQQTILEEIRTLRRDNNDFWMKIVQIALTHAPDETKAVMQEINRIDRAVTVRWWELSK